MSVYEGSDHTILEISDRGTGISDDEMGKIFDPIFSSKDIHFSMGLLLVKRIMSEHMGRIFCENHKGAGATFRIKLHSGRPERSEPMTCRSIHGHAISMEIRT